MEGLGTFQIILELNLAGAVGQKSADFHMI